MEQTSSRGRATRRQDDGRGKRRPWEGEESWLERPPLDCSGTAALGADRPVAGGQICPINNWHSNWRSGDKSDKQEYTNNNN